MNNDTKSAEKSRFSADFAAFSGSVKKVKKYLKKMKKTLDIVKTPWYYIKAVARERGDDGP